MQHLFQTILRTARNLALMGLLVGPGGCGEKVQEPESMLLMPDGIEWPYWPLSMRFHPLTRFVESEQENLTLLEARLEFADRDDDISKCYGVVTLRLYDLPVLGESGELLSSWEVDLRDLETNRGHFDDITQTYLIRLEVETTKLTERMELFAKFDSEEGRSFNGSFVFE